MGGVLKHLGSLMVWWFFVSKPLLATQLVAESVGPAVSAVCDVTNNEVVSHAPGCLDGPPISTQTTSVACSPEEGVPYAEYPSGAGLGRGRYNSRGDWEGFYAIGFADSNGRPYFQAGFGWIPT